MSSGLHDLLPSIGAEWGLPGWDGPLRFGLGQHVVVLLIDGLGSHILADHAALAPYLASAAERSPQLRVGSPTTTVTSLTSIGTGLRAGAHGIPGYVFFLPEANQLYCPLAATAPVPPEVIQPQPSLLDSLDRVGLSVTTVVPAAFQGSGLTRLALSGGRFIGIDDESDVDTHARLVGEAATGPGLTYTYVKALDHAGHAHGVDSDRWRSALAWADTLAADVRRRLPDDVRLVITGDHGMVDVPLDRRIVIEDIAGIAPLRVSSGGEGRFRHLYTDHPDELAGLLRRELGDRGDVRLRDEAIGADWFGAVTAGLRARFGDVIVAMRDDWALLTQRARGEWNLTGMHGSTTDAEALVPLICD